MAFINFISSIASGIGRRRHSSKAEKAERKEPVQVRLIILETNNYFQDPIMKEGVMMRQPKVGEPFRLMNFTKDGFIHSTSKVTSVIDEFTFTTENSKYRIEKT